MLSGARAGRAFFSGHVLDVARALLGAVVVHDAPASASGTAALRHPGRSAPAAWRCA